MSVHIRDCQPIESFSIDRKTIKNNIWQLFSRRIQSVFMFLRLSFYCANLKHFFHAIWHVKCVWISVEFFHFDFCLLFFGQENAGTVDRICLCVQLSITETRSRLSRAAIVGHMIFDFFFCCHRRRKENVIDEKPNLKKFQRERQISSNKARVSLSIGWIISCPFA